MRTVQQLLPLLASLFPLLLLIDIFDGVGTNNKTIIMDWYMLDDNVDLLVEFDVVSVSIRFPQDNYYSITPSIYVKSGNAIDCFI